MSKRFMWEVPAGKTSLAILSVILSASLITRCVVAATPSTTDQKILHYVRERFGIPDSTTLTIAPLQNSKYIGFYKTSIYIQKGKEKKSQPVLITNDGHCLVIGDVFVASPVPQPNFPANASTTTTKIVDYVRTKFKVPAAVKLTVGPFRSSDDPHFYQMAIIAQGGKKKSSTPAYVTKDGRYVVLGSVFNLNADPRKKVQQAISLNNQPTVGPANAPVTIVEFADLECPSCAELHSFFATNLIPKYGNKIRIVFKEFPLASIHPWALTAAVANKCGYQLNPADYFEYRSTIFKSQGRMNAANARRLLLDWGQRAGLDRLRLSQCLDSKASLSQVEADVLEGQKLGISATPTLFINGARVVGYDPDRIYQLIDQDLQRAASQ